MHEELFKYGRSTGERIIFLLNHSTTEDEAILLPYAKDYFSTVGSVLNIPCEKAIFEKHENALRKIDEFFFKYSGMHIVLGAAELECSEWPSYDFNHTEPWCADKKKYRISV